jgi:hypothetical protein
MSFLTFDKQKEIINSFHIKRRRFLSQKANTCLNSRPNQFVKV